MEKERMSWTKGTRIFEQVSEAIERREEGEISGKELVSALIKALKDEGWDPEDYGVGGLDEESIIREAMAHHGNVEKCSSEHRIHPWQCEGDKGHYPTTLHQDYVGNTWTHEEEL
jgi:hypothetical protein